ncbi:hypothetical protein J6590_014599 [Homalodisca vitripennis]|nr:hypothetical protein J6590_014599 [Homalodisca vitripennis]
MLEGRFQCDLVDHHPPNCVTSTVHQPSIIDMLYVEELPNCQIVQLASVLAYWEREIIISQHYPVSTLQTREMVESTKADICNHYLDNLSTKLSVYIENWVTCFHPITPDTLAAFSSKDDYDETVLLTQRLDPLYKVCFSLAHRE